MLERLGRWMSLVGARDPFTNVVGLSRSLLALGTLLTLAFNSTSTLFPPAAAGIAEGPNCAEPANVGLFCVVPSLEVGRWLGVAILLLVLSGWRPRWTAVPHWWVAFSLQNNAVVVDGGDQVAAVVSLLLVPVLLCDGRRNHWQGTPVRAEPSNDVAIKRFTAWAMITAIRVQVAFLYFHAGVAKFGVREWADGTALYYWFTDPTFGTSSWLWWLFEPILYNGYTVTAFTWGTALAEIALGLAILVPSRHYRYFLIYAISFHIAIALAMGLVSFAFSMIAADIMYLRLVHRPFYNRLLARVAHLSPARRKATRRASAPLPTGRVDDRTQEDVRPAAEAR